MLVQVHVNNLTLRERERERERERALLRWLHVELLVSPPCVKIFTRQSLRLVSKWELLVGS